MKAMVKIGIAALVVIAVGLWAGLHQHVVSLLSAEQARSAGDPEPTLEAEPLPVTSLPQTPRVVGFGHVDVEGGTVPLTVPNIGQVAEVLVTEGDRVKSGEPMVRLRNQQAVAKVTQAKTQVDEAKLAVQDAEQAPELFVLKLDQQKQAVAAAIARHDAARSEIERLQGLVDRSVLPSDKLAAAKERLPEAEAAVEVEKLKLKELQMHRPEDAIQKAKIKLQAAEAQLALAEENLQTHTLTAPEDGLVLRVLVSKGQMLGPNSSQPSVWFCPDRARIVRCEINEEFATRVKPGMQATVYADDVDGTTWQGHVTRCADWIAHRRSLLDEPFQKNDVRTLECVVQLDGQSAAPRIGRRLRVVLFPQPNEERASLPLAKREHSDEG